LKKQKQKDKKKYRARQEINPVLFFFLLFSPKEFGWVFYYCYSLLMNQQTITKPKKRIKVLICFKILGKILQKERSTEEL
jgi:hypothetical protein